MLRSSIVLSWCERTVRKSGGPLSIAPALPEHSGVFPMCKNKAPGSRRRAQIRERWPPPKLLPDALNTSVTEPIADVAELYDYAKKRPSHKTRSPCSATASSAQNTPPIPDTSTLYKLGHDAPRTTVRFTTLKPDNCSGGSLNGCRDRSRGSSELAGCIRLPPIFHSSVARETCVDQAAGPTCFRPAMTNQPVTRTCDHPLVTIID